jgi:O-antigen/teichoic acid export membrane protein
VGPGTPTPAAERGGARQRRDAAEPGHYDDPCAADAYSRPDETSGERLDRNFGELLQELRVAQTGVQILFAFLLGIAFQARFTSLDSYGRSLYAVTLLLAATSAVLLIAPVAVHRVLFRQHLKDHIVAVSARWASAGLVILGLAILSAVLFVLTVVLSVGAGVAAAVGLLALLLTTWLVVPLRRRARAVREAGRRRDAHRPQP